MTETTVSAAARFVDALAAHDFDALQAALAPEVRFRALIPPGFREAAGAAEARRLIESWFGDSEEYAVVSRVVAPVGDREHAAYRVEGRENGEGYVVEQQFFATLGPAGIARLDLLCSGFRPR